MAGVNWLDTNNLWGLGMWRAGKRAVKEDFKGRLLWGPKDPAALSGRKGVRKWRPVELGHRFVVMDAP